MTDPLLWLHGDPTEGRRVRVREPEEPAAPAPSPDSPPPVPPRSRRGGRLAAAVAGGLVSATLVTGGAAAFGLLDAGDPPAANPPGPAAASVGARQQGDIAAIYKAASPSVVSVRTDDGSGTGFVVDTDGTIVTNAHVVGDANEVQVQFADDRSADATVRGVDRSSDLAVLDVDPADTGRLQALELADSTTVRTGQLAVAIGSPFGLPQTATAGIVSGTGRHIQAPDGFQIDSVIQTDAPINPGNSGGPLLDANGRVIGVNSQIQTGGNGNGNVGIGFAVPANTVRDVIPRLERGETIRRPYLGVSTAPADGGARVQEATAGGPAAKAGLRAGDLIVSVGAAAVREPDDVAAAIQDRRPGQTVRIEIERGGDRRTLEVELATRPASAP
jgi:putative serine protease PepD